MSACHAEPVIPKRASQPRNAASPAPAASPPKQPLIPRALQKAQPLLPIFGTTENQGPLPGSSNLPQAPNRELHDQRRKIGILHLGQKNDAKLPVVNNKGVLNINPSKVRWIFAMDWSTYHANLNRSSLVPCRCLQSLGHRDSWAFQGCSSVLCQTWKNYASQFLLFA